MYQGLKVSRKGPSQGYRRVDPIHTGLMLSSTQRNDAYNGSREVELVESSRPVTVDELVDGQHVPESQRRYLQSCRERNQHTVDWVQRRGLCNGPILEIGLGATGICCRLMGAQVSAWDISEAFADTAERCDIPLTHVDLNDPDWEPPERNYYDVVIVQEVIEHLYSPPQRIFERIRAAIRPGGVIVVTTLNLVRLNNRIRLARGKGLFAPFDPESLVMGHLREYTLPELAGYLERAGFTIQEKAYHRWDLGKWAFLRPLLALFPKLSTYIWLVGQTTDWRS